MPTTMATERGHNPAASMQLPARTVTWLADRPHVRTLVRAVWDKLTDLERAGQHPDAIATLRFILIHHQPPTPHGRCRTCRRLTWRHLWRRRPFPCTIWMTIHLGLQGLFTRTGYHSKPDTPRQPETVAPPEAVLQAHPDYPITPPL
ncbi:MAG: hypothetical protein ACRDRA_12245 [Pseudonocardiaceae bacterium]